MADKARKATDKQLAKMERHLTEIYNRASKELGESWKNYLSEVAKEIEPLERAYREAKAAGDAELTKKAGRKLQAKKQEMTLLDRHYKNLSEKLAQDISAVNETAVAYINGKLPEIYAINYNHVGKNIGSQIKGISFELVDANTVKNLATNDKTLLPYKEINGKKDVRWNVQKVNSEVLQGILQGESMGKIALRLENVENMNCASSIRNARTSVTSAENKGRMDMLHEAEEKGVVVHKVWLATHDGRVRDSHLDLDGEEREIDEPFENVLVLSKTRVIDDEIMYPGDPNANPANTYNCRCSLSYKVVGFKGG